MLVLLPFSMGAQEVDQSVEKRIDSLATEVTTLDKVVQKLSNFKVSAYIQGQYQYGQIRTRTWIKGLTGSVSAGAV